ncbi:MAG: histidinol dehydrogenase, partial [Actinomycetia bacterium]|nr:histidinol dehydrogenase [Actinomycetes bacterium]
MIEKIVFKKNIRPKDYKPYFERKSIENQKASQSVKEIIKNVRNRKDEALKEYTLQFDHVDLASLGIKVGKAEIKNATKEVEKEFLEALSFAVERITLFHEKIIPTSWAEEDVEGNFWGQIVKPIERVGVYVPGGTASYPSSVLMNIIPAQIAGVEEIAVCIPPDKNGNINKYVLAALDFVKEYEVYRVG